MAMKREEKFIYLFALILILTMTAMTEGAVTCSPIQLSPCAAAITSSAPPSGLCCQRLRQQKPCLCGYLRNPSLRRYVNSPNARRVSSQCKLPYPKC